MSGNTVPSAGFSEVSFKTSRFAKKTGIFGEFWYRTMRALDIIQKCNDTGFVPCCIYGENIVKELYMKTKGVFGIAILLMVIGIVATSCVTATSIGGSSEGHGLFSGGAAKAAVTDGAQEIASYQVILGFVDSGYENYAAAVKEAEAAGKQVTTTVTWYFNVLVKYTAYAK
jgi:hypothetical protein